MRSANVVKQLKSHDIPAGAKSRVPAHGKNSGFAVAELHYCACGYANVHLHARARRGNIPYLGYAQKLTLALSDGVDAYLLTHSVAKFVAPVRLCG